MSFAVNDEKEPSEGLQRAIESVKSKVSIFAAAGNIRIGKAEPVAYPARSGDVIRIYSFDGSGKASNFNPPIEPQITRYMGCIGESLIEPIRKTEILPGSSTATAIAAGIGALVLDFARFYADGDFKEGNPDLDLSKNSKILKHKRVVEHILWEMTTMQVSSYSLIRPQAFFRLDEGWVEAAAAKILHIMKSEKSGRLQG
jgi:hypothetical protein